MDAHEFDRAVVTRRATERQRPQEPSQRLTMPSALLSLQRMAGNESVSALLADEEAAQTSPVHEVVGSGGSPVEPGARTFLEQRMGHDFSDVRVHTGPKADESARSISAQAYTVGSDVVFRSGAYQPDTPGGRHVLAHELAHVVQQRSGPVAGTPAPGGIRLSDPGDPFEQAAERTAAETVAGPAPSPVPAADTGITAQRAGEEEEEVAQALTAQRAGEEEEEEPAG